MESKGINSLPQPKSDHQDERSLRRFGIIDLMLVTAVMALQFKLQSIWLADAEHTVPSWVMGPLLFLSATVTGLSLSALYWLPLQYFQTKKLFRRPGHWILGASSAVSVGELIFMIWFVVVQNGDSSQSNDPFMAATFFVMAASHLVGVILLIVSIFSLRGRWRLAGVVLAACFSIEALKYVIFGVAFLWMNSLFSFAGVLDMGGKVTSLLAGFFVAVSLITDLMRKTKQDWLHWAGVVVVLISVMLLPLFQFLYQRFLIFDGSL